jgi:PEGA domain
MNSWRRAWFAIAVAAASSLTGCVERRFVITTDPPGAIVLDEKGMSMGPAPVDRQWIYNGVYEFKVMKDGFETLTVRENVSPRWFEYVGIDFIAENIIPWTIRDIRRFHYQLQPLAVMPPEMILQQGQALRQRGQAIGVTLGDPSAAPPVPATPQ